MSLKFSPDQLRQTLKITVSKAQIPFRRLIL